ncbi:heme o synthase [Coxiella-like endosymbiont of Amblyomma americanum]|uniref:heme o synthase n=1 Tax=Coxiella-like endosymbiont of Amblyomma americanum TaxID=1987500 RepID=UPI000F89D70C|nr:heme o synthase [Coxiella-like endosymbiont of Amblyomma americanum]AUJ58921.1 protoheme IX farnesyltransferase [Coxiella-like endosymbiont of Amblyomma americanum]
MGNYYTEKSSRLFKENHWKAYLRLCKPRIVLLIILTTAVGMCLVSPGIISWRLLLFGNLGIALAASSAAALNQILEHRIDSVMHRTNLRPIVREEISLRNAIIFSSILCILSVVILMSYTNVFATLLTLIILISYAGIYTLFLKHITSQNIVIGGLAGAAPPLLGGVVATGHINFFSVILSLIIFIWTPPHFWALAIHCINDYDKVNIPMLPNVHGIFYTKLNILIYTFLLSIISLLPFVVGMSGWIYFLSAFLLNIVFIYWAIRLYVSNNPKVPIRVFRYSILYLTLLFLVLLIDHYFIIFYYK